MFRNTRNVALLGVIVLLAIVAMLLVVFTPKDLPPLPPAATPVQSPGGEPHVGKPPEGLTQGTAGLINAFDKKTPNETAKAALTRQPVWQLTRYTIYVDPRGNVGGTPRHPQPEGTIIFTLRGEECEAIQYIGLSRVRKPAVKIQADELILEYGQKDQIVLYPQHKNGQIAAFHRITPIDEESERLWVLSPGLKE